MKLGILVTGPNASGKTTAVTEALKGWTVEDGVKAIHADNSDRGLFEPTFAPLEQLWQDPIHVMVLEGTSRVANALGRILSIRGDNAPFNDGGPESTAGLLTPLWSGAYDVIVAEGTDRFARALAAVGGERHLEVAITTQTPDAMRTHLQSRCLARGKKYNAAYWDVARLTYEGSRRYVNMANRLFPQATFWPIGADFDGAAALVEHIRALIGKAFSDRA